MVTKKQNNTYIRELYDSFRIKDCTFTEFKRRYTAAMDPKGIRRDVSGMVDQIHRGKQLRRKIGAKS